MKQVRMYTVMVASPSDIPEARQALKDAIHGWNDSNSIHRNIILLPLLWESNSVPLIGNGDAQEVINRQLVAKADIIFAIFGHRLGQPTSRALSGTAAEMQEAHKRGKPVHPYFSEADIPHNADLEQVEKLRTFKDELGGLYSTFNNVEELKFKVWQAIEADLAHLDHEEESDSSPASHAHKRVDLLVQPGEDRYPETDNKGRLKYKTRRWVEITNRGEIDAHEVNVEPAYGEGNFFMNWPGPITIQHGQTRKAPLFYTMATSRPEIVITWKENGEGQTMRAQLD